VSHFAGTEEARLQRIVGLPIVAGRVVVPFDPTDLAGAEAHFARAESMGSALRAARRDALASIDVARSRPGTPIDPLYRRAVAIIDDAQVELDLHVLRLRAAVRARDDAPILDRLGGDRRSFPRRGAAQSPGPGDDVRPEGRTASGQRARRPAPPEDGQLRLPDSEDGQWRPDARPWRAGEVGRARPAWPEWSGLRDFDDLLDLTGIEFELFARDVLGTIGYRQVQHAGGAGDESVDVWCTGEEGERVAVQCKKYRPPRAVGTPEMQQFVGMIYAHHGASRGIYVTTSRFRDRAIAMARRNSIELIDGLGLCRLMDWQPPRGLL
jgi:hypothetical protein